MRIGVDLDDVLFDCNTSLARFHNSRYGTSYERKDVWTWHLELLWGCTKDEFFRRVMEFYDSPEHALAGIVPGASAAIEELSSLHELHIVTSRPSQIRELTSTWLEPRFPKKFSGLHFTNHAEPGGGSKADVCRDLGVSLLIEDSLFHAREVAASGTTVLLLDTPWNQEPVSEPIVRVSAWQDALDFIASNNAPAS